MGSLESQQANQIAYLKALKADGAKNATQGLVNPNIGNAQVIAAQLIQNQYNNWKENFEPYELSALQQSSLNNPQVLTDQVNQAATNAANMSTSLQGVQARQLSGLGVKPTAAQSADMTRLNNLSQAAAIAGAKNQARANVANENEQLALGGVPKTLA